MRVEFFGDSYDIVKKSLIAWLGSLGDWSAHPMFTEPVSTDQSASFSSFLGAHFISNEMLTPRTNREKYFSSCRSVGNLFLDPDTGVRLKRVGGAKSVQYIFGQELIELSLARPSALTLVFDQSYPRGSQALLIQGKLAYFASHGVHGFAYSSHAAFLILGGEAEIVGRARRNLLEMSGLPPVRLVTLPSI